MKTRLDPGDCDPSNARHYAQSFRLMMLDLHATQRAALGIAPLIWDDELAEAARVAAEKLVIKGAELRHDSAALRRTGQGENLASGTTTISAAVLAGLWLSEKSKFRENGIFGQGGVRDASTTGNSLDTAHYSQMIWGATKRVGCAVADAGTSRVLVCRYSPAGNLKGDRPVTRG